MLTDEETRNPYLLSSLADCATPDNPQSPGAAFLLEVADEAANGPRTEADPYDEASRIANEAVYRQESRGSHGLILAAVDLCAYREETEDLIEPTNDVHHLLTVGLYMIAERLAAAILTEQKDN